MEKEKTSVRRLLELSLGQHSADSEAAADLPLTGGLSAGWHIEIHNPHLQIGAVTNSFSFVGRPVRKLIQKGKLSYLW